MSRSRSSPALPDTARLNGGFVVSGASFFRGATHAVRRRLRFAIRVNDGGGLKIRQSRVEDAFKMEGGGTDQRVQSMLAAIGSFKDWSNYLLVTTVAALGWVASKGSSEPNVILVSATGNLSRPRGTVSATSNILGYLDAIEVALLAGSAIFGILTLSLVPIVTENINTQIKTKIAHLTTLPTSIYDIPAPYNLFYMLGPTLSIRLKWFCLPQHALLILAIAIHAYRYWRALNLRFL